MAHVPLHLDEIPETLDGKITAAADAMALAILLLGRAVAQARVDHDPRMDDIFDVRTRVQDEIRRMPLRRV